MSNELTKAALRQEIARAHEQLNKTLAPLVRQLAKLEAGESVPPILRTPPAASGQQEDLHDAIMRLPCNVPSEVLEKHSYKVGHRDARHAAAELAAAHAAHPAPAQQESEALRYAKHIATSIWRDNYKDTAPEWQPFDDLHGVLSQIDNMTCGMRRAPAPAALTDEQIDAVYRRHYQYTDPETKATEGMKSFARAILATASAAPAEQARDAPKVQRYTLYQGDYRGVLAPDDGGKWMLFADAPALLREDTERLSFIEQNPEKQLRHHKKRWSFVGFTNYEYETHKTVREAIDAARASQQKGGQA